MDASLIAPRMGAGALPLDTMPLDILPLDGPAPWDTATVSPAFRCQRVAPTAQRPATPALATASPREDGHPRADQAPARTAATQAAPQARRALSRRRPLARFVQEEDSPIFYISLSDLMCLLLVFFVLIFSLGQPSGPLASQPGGQPAVRVIYKAAMPVAQAAPPAPASDPFALDDASAASARQGLLAVALAGSSDPGLPAPVVAELSDNPQERPGPRLDRDLLALLSASDSLPAQAAPLEEASLNQLLGQVRQVSSGQEQNGLVVERGSDTVVLRLPEAITFDLAKAEIKPGMKSTLGRLAEVLARHPRTAVVVTGHTDDLPINTPQFASNWELSAARAASVGRALMTKGIDKSRVSIRGLADQQPRLPNLDENARQQNRRVEIELRPLG
ncbi:MAG: OmpA family protein [Desulfarculus sp.]|nr:OmpA family protein [Desulfarculus sp.]